MATIRTQEQLETIFSNNRIPEGSDFADLIATIFERMTPTEADSRYPTKTAASNTFATKNYVDSALGSIDFSGLANDCNGIIFGHKKDYTNYKCSGLIPFTRRCNARFCSFIRNRRYPICCKGWPFASCSI